ncbi:uncharacterized protein LOC119023611 [Acanthopagrus latus]|uniref:uncharacterized protein LOC119023611 n=1 Tax=Acanthopagrus latus TaxID=8177 RepID=UPI00187C6125|nr:uncharacterized protein LOC119023611 [Acanthopagrus latus]
MSKRKHNVTPNTEETDWLRENVPRRTLTRWKKRKINKTLSDIEKHTAQRHEIDEDASQSKEQRAEPFTLTQEIDEDASQSKEQRAEPFTLTQEVDDDASQREEHRAEPFTLTQESDEDASQREEQRAEPFTLPQDNVPQAIDDVHTHGLTEEQSCISILSFALRHNTTAVLMEDLLKLLKLHSAGTSAVPARAALKKRSAAGGVGTALRTGSAAGGEGAALRTRSAAGGRAVLDTLCARDA